MANITGVNFLSAKDSAGVQVNIIGLAFSLYATVSTQLSACATPPDHAAVGLQIGLVAGREQGDWLGPGGHIPSIVLRDEFGNKFGEKLNENLDRVGDGSYAPLFVPVPDPRESPHYISLFQPSKFRGNGMSLSTTAGYLKAGEGSRL